MLHALSRAVRIFPFLLVGALVLSCGGDTSSASTSDTAADTGVDRTDDAVSLPETVSDTLISEDTSVGVDTPVVDTTPPSDEGSPMDSVTTPPSDEGSPMDSVIVPDTAPAPDTATGPAPDPGIPGAFEFNQSSVTLSQGGGSFGGDNTELTVLSPEGTDRPVVLFLPGFQLNPADYTSTREHLASHGFFVVSPSFPGSLLSPKNNVELKIITKAILDWLEAEAAGDLAGVLDISRIAAVGHSLGGKIALLTATEEERIDAVFGIDPVDSGPPIALNPSEYPSVTPELMGQIQVPLLLLGETTNASGGLGTPCAPAEDNFQQYYQAAVSPAMEVEVLGANHMSFLDNPNCLVCFTCPKGTDDPATTRLVMRRLLVAFLADQLNTDSPYGSWLAGADLQSLVTDGLIQVATKNGF